MEVKMAQPVEASVAKPDDMSSILEAYTVKAENQVPRAIIWPPQTCAHTNQLFHRQK